MSLGWMRNETGGVGNEAYFSKSIVSLEEYLSGLKTTDYQLKNYFL